jgi:hypothetical protein
LLGSAAIIQEGIGHGLEMPMLIGVGKLAGDPFNQGVEEDLDELARGRAIAVTQPSMQRQ